MTEASGKDSVGVQKEQAEGLIAVNKRKEGDKGQMTVADFLKMTEDDRKVVR
jgi:threonyl-tRNA synthetase